MNSGPSNYQLLKDIYESQGRLEQKLDTRLQAIEQRLTTLEQWKWYLMGSVALFTFFFSFFKEEILRRVGIKS